MDQILDELEEAIKQCREKLKKEKTIKWSTKDKIVFSNWRSYNKVRRITPEFQYGTTPKGYKDNYRIEDRGNKEYVVIQEFSGYTSLKDGYVPGKKDIFYRGTLRECKKWLADLIKKYYEEGSITE